jgi:hypothetical protein
MYCKNCGKQVNDNSKFCYNCGFQFNISYKPVQNQNFVPVRKKKKWPFVLIVSAFIVALGFIFLLPADNANVLKEIKDVKDTGVLETGTISFKNTDNKGFLLKEIEYKSETEGLYSSNIFEVEGNIVEYDGVVKLEIPLNDKIKSIENYSEKTVVEISEFNLKDNESYYKEYRSVEIDEINNVARIEIELKPDDENSNLSDSHSIQLAGSRSASPDYTNYPRFDWKTMKEGKSPRTRLSFRFISSGWYYITRKVENYNFNIYIENTTSSDIYFYDLMTVTLDYLEEARILSEEFGYDLSKMKKPVNVYIRDIKQGGRFEISKYFRNSYSIIIADRFFKSDNEVYVDKESRYLTLKTVVGHEFLHLAQYLYHKDEAKWMHEEISWLKEAVARWFEGRLRKSASYFDKTVYDNMDFIKESLYLDYDLGTMYSKGIFIKYLKNRFDDKKFTPLLFENSVKAYINLGKPLFYPDNISINALELTAKHYNKDFNTLWQEFILLYFTKPGDINRGLNTDYLKDTITMKSKDLEDEDKSYYFDTRLNPDYGKVINKTKGTLKSSSDPAIAFRYNLKNMSAQCIELNILAPNGAYDEEGKLVIEVITEGNTGVMVYSKRGEKIAGVNNYLSTNKDKSITLEKFSATRIGELLIIPFSFDKSESPKTNEVKIKITYTPKREPKPTPTPKPDATISSNNDNGGTVYGTGNALLTGMYNGGFVSYWDEGIGKATFRIESSKSHDGQYSFSSDGSCYFGYVNRATGKRIVYSKHHGTYEILSEETTKTGIINISIDGDKLPKSEHVIQYVRLNLTTSEEIKTGNTREWKSTDEIVVIDGKYIGTGYGFGAYIKD